jgi:hypothetical protein
MVHPAGFSRKSVIYRGRRDCWAAARYLRGPVRGPDVEIAPDCWDLAASRAECPTGCPQSADPVGHPPESDEIPPWALAVAEVRPRGLDRQGRGRSQRPGLPRDEARIPSRRLGRNPPSGTPVTKKDANADTDGCLELLKGCSRTGHEAVRRFCKKLPARDAAALEGDLTSSATAKAISP